MRLHYCQWSLPWYNGGAKNLGLTHAVPMPQPSIIPIDLGPSNGAAGLLLLIAWPLAVLLILLYLLTVAAEKLLDLITTTGENPNQKNAHSSHRQKRQHQNRPYSR